MGQHVNHLKKFLQSVHKEMESQEVHKDGSYAGEVPSFLSLGSLFQGGPTTLLG